MIRVDGARSVINKLRRQKKSPIKSLESFVFNEALYQWAGSEMNPKITVIPSPKGLVLEIQGPQVLFYEFGAGIRYSGTRHPKSTELGMGAGTYPSEKGFWNRPQGWWYPVDLNSPEADRFNSDGTKAYAHTYGNPAYMPTYKTAVAIREHLRKRGYKTT